MSVGAVVAAQPVTPQAEFAVQTVYNADGLGAKMEIAIRVVLCAHETGRLPPLQMGEPSVPTPDSETCGQGKRPYNGRHADSFL